MANVGIYDMTDTWNNAGTAFTAIKMNVTDTASASGSKLLDVQKGGSSYLELNKNGELGILDKIFHLGDTNTAIRFPAADTVTVETAGSERLRIDSSGNVGIGVASPSGFFDVRKSNPSADVLVANFANPNNSTPGTSATIGLTTIGSSAATLRGCLIRAVQGSSSNQHDLLFYTNAPSASPAERMRITSDGYLRMASSSGGIQFNGDTAAANALDDYEEGTWTPVYASSSGTFTTMTMDILGAKYTKIGQAVFVTCAIRTDEVVLGTAGGALQIDGLPFTADGSGNSAFAIGFNQNFATNHPTLARIDGSEAYIRLAGRSAMTGNPTNITPSDMTTGAVANQNLLVLSGVYFV